jgi:hypothetical protein
MSDLDRRPSRVPRSTRERRAYRLVLAGGTFTAIAVIGAILAIASSFSWGWPFLAAVLAAVCLLLFRRTVS